MSNQPLASRAIPAFAAASTQLSDRYQAIRSASLALVAPLSNEDCQVQSMPDASPAKWHLAHTTWFFETFILQRYEADFQPFDDSFVVLFNSYYQGIGDQYPRAQRGLMTRPGLEQVKAYRHAVDQRICELLASGREVPQLLELLEIGLNHEQQHQELLLTDIKHLLSINPFGRPYAKRWPIGAVQAQATRWLAYEGGMFEIGYDEQVDGPFCFDNETPRHRCFTEPFELASRPVSYGDYLDFIDDGGYQRAELWLSMGWDWVQQGGRAAPLYWSKRDGRWLNHSLQGLIEIDPHTPVCHLSYFEADAFARWAGARLPSEAEWEYAARRLQHSGPGNGNFANRGAFHPLPPAKSVLDEPSLMFGDVWEWTQSNYNAYPGFRALPGVVGEYNGKFMCNQYVLRGGSCVTPPGHVRTSYRNFFPPEAQWQFSGLRLAR